MISCLIVEYNQLSLMIMKRQATTLGLKVTAYGNGQEALDYCVHNPMPELILLDGCMPHMDGVNFVKRMRVMKDGTKPYVVFCSSSLDRSDVAMALDAGRAHRTAICSATARHGRPSAPTRHRHRR